MSGAVLRVYLLPGGTAFRTIVALFLLPLGDWRAVKTPPREADVLRLQPAAVRAIAAVTGVVGASAATLEVKPDVSPDSGIDRERGHMRCARPRSGEKPASQDVPDVLYAGARRSRGEYWAVAFAADGKANDSGAFAETPAPNESSLLPLGVFGRSPFEKAVLLVHMGRASDRPVWGRGMGRQLI